MKRPSAFSINLRADFSSHCRNLSFHDKWKCKLWTKQTCQQLKVSKQANETVVLLWAVTESITGAAWGRQSFQWHQCFVWSLKHRPSGSPFSWRCNTYSYLLAVTWWLWLKSEEYRRKSVQYKTLQMAENTGRPGFYRTVCNPSRNIWLARWVNV